MAINTFEYAKILMTKLDQHIMHHLTSSWMEPNASRVQYNGGAEVKIPTLSTTGLGDYDRDTGYTQGGVSLSYQTKVMTQDRGTKFQLDAMDVNETNFIANATAVTGDFQKRWVAPEIDAYRYSTLFAKASAGGYATTDYAPSVDDIYSRLYADLNLVRRVVGSSVPLMITTTMDVIEKLSLSKEVNRSLSVSEFDTGNVKLTVKNFDTAMLNPVPDLRMKTEYLFKDQKTTGQEEGGFVATETAKDINWIICPVDVPMAITKQDITRIFDPTVNQDLNAWRIDYRRYHDLWVLDNQLEAVRVNKKA